MKPTWRRWRPRQDSSTQRSLQATLQDPWDVFDTVDQRIGRIALGRIFLKTGAERASLLNPHITEAQRFALQVSKPNERSLVAAEAWLYALVLQAPRAAEAQLVMDRHPHGYHDKEARLFELIDFNDAFVSTALACTYELLPHLELEAKELMDKMSKKVGARCFSNEEYNAITHGLSREIAVYLGVLQEGYQAEMASRATDAFGIDMRIIEPKTMRFVDVDVKTRSAFHYRIHNLERDGRIGEEELIMADRNGFIAVFNGHDEEKRKVVIWRIDHEVLGDIVDFRFTDSKALGLMLRKILLYTGEQL